MLLQKILLNMIDYILYIVKDYYQITRDSGSPLQNPWGETAHVMFDMLKTAFYMGVYINFTSHSTPGFTSLSLNSPAVIFFSGKHLDKPGAGAGASLHFFSWLSIYSMWMGKLVLVVARGRHTSLELDCKYKSQRKGMQMWDVKPIPIIPLLLLFNPH